MRKIYKVDTLVKKLDVVNIVLTDSCNSKCKLCNYWKHKKKIFLDKKNVQCLIPYINKYKTRKIYLTGGEPLLHPNFYEIAKMLRENTRCKITLCTNGFLIPNFIDKIYPFFDAYIISFDAHTKSLYHKIRGVDWFQSIKKVPKLIKKKNPNVKIAFTCVIQKLNFKYLKKILIYADSIGCDFMGFTLPTLTKGGFGWKRIPSKLKRTTFLNRKEIGQLKRIIEEILKIEKKLRIKIIQPPDGLREYPLQLGYEIGINKPVPVECPLPFQEIVLDENGLIRPCYILPPLYKFKKNQDPVNNEIMSAFRDNFLKNPPKACYSCYIRLLHRHLNNQS
jgi:MoaA/NifB/PqqE/SkfB family radical SAM enzyme